MNTGTGDELLILMWIQVQVSDVDTGTGDQLLMLVWMEVQVILMWIQVQVMSC